MNGYLADDDPAVTDRPDPSALRWLIGNELREARRRAGATQTQAARVLNCTHSKINYLELGRNQPQPEEVTTLLRHYGETLAHADRVAALAGTADRGTWWAPFSDVVPDWLKTFVGLEGLAASEFMYEPLVLPGLVQTRTYLAHLLRDHLHLSRRDSERVAHFRVERQRRLLHGPRPLQFTAVMEEAVLYRAVGGDQVLQEQLQHLLELVERENITLHVMPFTTAVHDGLDGRFVVLRFAEARPVAYLEDPDGAIYAQDTARVEGYELRAERLCDAALTPEESVRLIHRRINELHTLVSTT